MAKKQDMFQNNHAIQLTWIGNQIVKGNNDIFVNPKKGLESFEVLNEDLHIRNEDVEKFVARYLSDAGKKRLLTTLRVAESRSKASATLQVRLEHEAIAKLNYLVLKSGMKKVDLVNKLIMNAELSDYQKGEEQLEITL